MRRQQTFARPSRFPSPRRKRHVIPEELFSDILAREPGVTRWLDAPALDALFDPRRYLGESAAYLERVLASHPED